MADDNKRFQFVVPSDSLRDDPARFMMHVVVMSVVVGLGLTLAGTVAMMSVWYWG